MAGNRVAQKIWTVRFLSFSLGRVPAYRKPLVVLYSCEMDWCSRNLASFRKEST